MVNSDLVQLLRQDRSPLRRHRFLAARFLAVPSPTVVALDGELFAEGEPGCVFRYAIYAYAPKLDLLTGSIL